ncbi:MFS transporter [Gordonia sp. LSe1-13]|uniref:MFS transporter n=1 Tax=Gordonia sesuvii TaxID=3116777 RepID=A0ABU7MEB3_9ACTN|nr:MFS transporter [Gordonia sp. LSe1-13]
MGTSRVVDDVADRRTWAGLGLLAFPMLMVAGDLTILFFAMPTITADLSPTATQVSWIVHVYGFVIAGFLVTMGRLGDRIGPRRLLLIGSSAFGIASLTAAFAPTATMLIASRAVLGVAGATLMPSLFSLLRVMFVDDQQRRVAIAAMMSAFSVGGAIGPLVGGALLQWFWWGSVFLVNVPIVILVVVGGSFLLPERDDRQRARLDPTSVVLSVTGTLAVVYGMQQVADSYGVEGVSMADLGIVVVGALVLVVFVRRQLRSSDPLFDFALLRNRPIGSSLAVILLCGIALVGTFYLLTQYLQWVVGLSPFTASLWTIPYIAANIVGFSLAPVLAAKVRSGSIILVGLAFGAIGLGMTALIAEAAGSTVAVMAAFAVAALGQGLAFALLSDRIISGAPLDRAGSAAAAQEVSGELGTALGTALATTLGLVFYRAALPTAAPESDSGAILQVRDGIHETADVAHGSESVIDIARDAFTSSVAMYSWVATALFAVATIVAAVLLVPEEAGTPDHKSSVR